MTEHSEHYYDTDRNKPIAAIHYDETTIKARDQIVTESNVAPAPFEIPLPLTKKQINSGIWDVHIHEEDYGVWVNKGKLAKDQALAAIILRDEVEKYRLLWHEEAEAAEAAEKEKS